MTVGEKLIFVKLCAAGKNIGMTLCQRHAFRMTRFKVWVGQLGKWRHVDSLKGWPLTFI